MFKRQGNKAPSATVQTLAGQSLSIPVPQKQLLVFWATWCGPCKVELARLNKLVKDGELNPANIIAISSSEDEGVVKSHAQENDYHFTVAVDPTGEVARKYKVSGTPTLVLIDETGTIKWMTMGISPSLELRLKSFFK